LPGIATTALHASISQRTLVEVAVALYSQRQDNDLADMEAGGRTINASAFPLAEHRIPAQPTFPVRCLRGRASLYDEISQMSARVLILEDATLRPLPARPFPVGPFGKTLEQAPQVLIERHHDLIPGSQIHPTNSLRAPRPGGLHRVVVRRLSATGTRAPH
jgi:hypothetical protein